MVVENIIRRKFGDKTFAWKKSGGYWPTKKQAKQSADYWRKAGHLARVTKEKRANGKTAYVRWIGPRRKLIIRKTIRINGEIYKLYGTGSKSHCNLLAKQARFGGRNARVIKINGRHAVYTREKRR